MAARRPVLKGCEYHQVLVARHRDVMKSRAAEDSPKREALHQRMFDVGRGLVTTPPCGACEVCQMNMGDSPLALGEYDVEPP